MPQRLMGVVVLTRARSQRLVYNREALRARLDLLAVMWDFFGDVRGGKLDGGSIHHPPSLPPGGCSSGGAAHDEVKNLHALIKHPERLIQGVYFNQKSYF